MSVQPFPPHELVSGDTIKITAKIANLKSLLMTFLGCGISEPAISRLGYIYESAKKLVPNFSSGESSDQ
jgi:hypothetical protein